MDLVDAIELANVRLVKSYIRKGVNINAINDRNRMTALEVASSRGHIEIVQVLLDAGAKLKSITLYTPLMMASSEGHTDVVKLLLSAGAEIEGQDEYGTTPLIHASSGNHFATVELLLDMGANIDKKDNMGKTALMEAVQYDLVAVVKLLIKRGADVHQTYDDGDTMFDVALLGVDADPTSYEVIDLLENASSIRAQYLLKRFRVAVHAWCITNYWWRVAGEGQHAPGGRGHKRACSEFARESFKTRA